MPAWSMMGDDGEDDDGDDDDGGRILNLAIKMEPAAGSAFYRVASSCCLYIPRAFSKHLTVSF